MFEKPFPNEHSARIINPSRFQPESFRRQNITKGIDIILGRLKGETSLTTQAYRFQKDEFTVAQAKKWLRDHDIEWILFEPATGDKMNEEKLFKAIEVPGLVKDVDKKLGIIKGYFAVFGNIDSDKDIIEPGAFTKSIAERGPKGTKRIKHLKYHDTRLVPGVAKELGEDEFGAWFVSQLAKNSEGEFSTLAKDTLIEYEAKVITEHSHGFQILQKEIDDAGIRHIIESKLWEFSSLGAWGANPLTSTEFVKNLKSEEDIIKYLNNITDRLKIGSFSDGYLEKLEKSYTELSAVYDSLKSKQKPDDSTSKRDEPINLDRVSTLF